jgi:hypothetical protein
MCAGNGRDIYELVADATERYFDFVKDIDNPIIKGYRSLGVPSFENCVAFYTGKEAIFPEFDEDLYRRLEDQISS